jgi:23S rRNA pseudouridine2605 synthase
MRIKEMVRLQKFIAECGIVSRRKAEELIVSGKVKVNGKTVTELGSKLNPYLDKITVNGKEFKQKEKKIYIKLNKPRGVVSACSDPRETTVIDLVKDIASRLYPVGRLDKESEGLIILTNDGELANRLMHPRYEHEKEYLVNVKLKMTNDKLKNLADGIVIDGKKTLPAKVTRISDRKFKIILREGRKRQIRLMVETVGNRVVKLKRTRIKNILLGKLPLGKYTHLSEAEKQGLRA